MTQPCSWDRGRGVLGKRWDMVMNWPLATCGRGWRGARRRRAQAYWSLPGQGLSSIPCVGSGHRRFMGAQKTEQGTYPRSVPGAGTRARLGRARPQLCLITTLQGPGSAGTGQGGRP